MANTTIVTDNAEKKFSAELFREYVTKGDFEGLSGTDHTSVIVMNRSLKETKLPFVKRLESGGVSGDEVLTGNEEAIRNFSETIVPKTYRNATQVSVEESDKTAFDIKQAARAVLMDWVMELKRDQMIQAMNAIEAGGVYYNYGAGVGATGATAASAANMDTWNTNNQDRILYGASRSNLVAGNHTSSLAAITASTDVVSLDVLDELNRMATNASPRIQPAKIGGKKGYVYFCNSVMFDTLRVALRTFHANAMPRSEDNVIFMGTNGRLMYNNTLIVEVPEIRSFVDSSENGNALQPNRDAWGSGATGDNLSSAGASSIEIGVGFFCGAAALAMMVGREPRLIPGKHDDYEHFAPVASTLKHDIRKVFFDGKQHGMITHFSALA